jgi:hypothetical protein
MKKFGVIKSKVEKLLIESYGKSSFQTEIKNFKKYILENKNISKLSYLYSELNSNKGLNESIINDYINECIIMYENTVNKIDEKDIINLNKWLSKIESENNYIEIDNLFSNDVLTIESKIKSRKLISENLKKTQVNKEIINLPIKSMINVANKTISKHIENLSESEKKEIFELLAQDDNVLKEQFDLIKNEVIQKLTLMKENSESEVINKIQETINKIKSENYDKLSYFKLKSLKENI